MAGVKYFPTKFIDTRDSFCQGDNDILFSCMGHSIKLFITCITKKYDDFSID